MSFQLQLPLAAGGLLGRPAAATAVDCGAKSKGYQCFRSSSGEFAGGKATQAPLPWV